MVPTGLVCWGVLISLSAVTCLDHEQLFPFGTEQGDTRLPVGDDVSSPEVDLETPIAFYNNLYSSVFVNLNGLISFETEIPSYKSDLIIPFGFKVIAPFFADIDISLSGNVYYRETRDPTLVNKARGDIVRSFPGFRTFRPTSLFIVTWDHVGFYDSQYDPTNSFQVVIASDGRNSFAMFLYPYDGLNWIKGDGKDYPVSLDIPAQAGFDSGNRSSHYYTLPGSGNQEVTKLTTWSNSGSDGVWIFRIGNTRSDNIETPATTTRNGDQADSAEARSCRDGGQQTCNTNAKCNDLANGFCCECNPPYIGNGVECMRPDEPQRISGKVSGTVNGVTLDDVDLHAYIVTTDGRTYTAISRIPPTIGQSLLGLYTIGGILGFVFALPQQPTAKNGFMITGGNFNRTAIVKFSNRETVTIRQRFTGPDVPGHMRMSTTLEGSLPRIAENAKIEIDDYKEDYRRSAPGVLKLSSQQVYKVDGVLHRFTVDETINFKECSARPLTGLDNLRIGVSRNFVVYSDKELIVRYSQTNKVSIGGATDDPCRLANCDPNASCQQSGSSYQCTCNRGYQGTGQRCQDVDECRQGGHDCHQEAATCYNTEGSFECRCKSGYTGDGKNCQDVIKSEQDTCRTLQNCDADADCLYSIHDGAYVCECRSGFRGDGYRCDPDDAESVAEDCTVAAICDANAQCLMDEYSEQYRCQCNEGYDGDGRSCSKRDCRRDASVCNRNARCERRGEAYECVCNAGFRGDGYQACISGSERSGYLLYAQGMYIMEAPFNPTPAEPGKVAIYIPGQNVIGLDVDCYSQYLYFTDVIGKSITRSRLDGTDSEVVVRNLGSPEGVAIDWIGKNIYWTDSDLDRIQMSRLNGSSPKTLFSEDLVNPRSIAVDPVRGVMFWTDWDRASPKVERSNMDGTDRRVLVSEGLGLPNGLALDYDGQMVCWADAGTRKVECVTYEGRNRKVVSSAAGYPFGLVFANNNFYWTDWEKRNTLPNANKHSDRANEDIALPFGGNGRLYGITSVNPCPSGSNPCAYNNGGCRFLCLPTLRGGRTCACPDDIDPDECNRIAFL